MKWKFFLILGLLFAVILASGYMYDKRKEQRQAQTAPPPIAAEDYYRAEPPTKIVGCKAAGGLPDRACTPGAVNTDVTQDNIHSTICVPGYTKTIRPSTSYTNSLKQQQFIAYGITGSSGDYQEDHLIPLALGGDPIDPANLWPASYASSPGAREKDRVENYLQDRVCEGSMSLVEAQRQIATDWVAVYENINNE